MDVPANIINGKTMVPVRFVSESLEADVKWDGNTNSTIITQNDKIIVVNIQEDFKIDKDFLSYASKGKMKGTKAQLGIEMTVSDLIEEYGNPVDIIDYDGGLGLKFNDFVYFVDAYGEVHWNKTLNTIEVWGEKAINMNINQIKATIGNPSSEGWSEIDDEYYLLYEVGDYMVYFFSSDPNTKANRLMLRDNWLND